MTYYLRTRFGFLVKATRDVREAFAMLASNPELQIYSVEGGSI